MLGEHTAMLGISVGIPNCITRASTSYKNCFQCAAIPLTELIQENTLLLETNCLIVLFKFLLTIPAVSVPSSILCRVEFID